MKADDDARAAEYEICKRRGHQPADRVLTSNPPQNVCKWCGATYHFDQVLIESHVPVQS